MIFDIVKRRSIRVGSCDGNVRTSPFIISGSLPAPPGTKVLWRNAMILLAKLDRLVIGSILRSKLVFLINVRPHD